MLHCDDAMRCCRNKLQLLGGLPLSLSQQRLDLSQAKPQGTEKCSWQHTHAHTAVLAKLWLEVAVRVSRGGVIGRGVLHCLPCMTRCCIG